jgi:hypothetical protein
MKTLILLSLLSLTASAAEAQSVRLQPARNPYAHRTVVVPAFRQPVIVQRGGSCGIGRWIDGVFVCQAGPVERALDQLNDTLARRQAQDEQAAISQRLAERAALDQALAQHKANEKAASDAAYMRAMTPVFAPPAGLGPTPEPADDGIRKQVAPNGTIIFSNVR